MLPEEIVDAVCDTASGFRAVDYVTGISMYHRIQASPGLHDALKYIKSEIESISDFEVSLFEYAADGKGKIGLWENLYGWFPKQGTLKLIEPEKKTLADFDAEPISMAAHSTSVDIEAEVVFVGKGLASAEYDEKEIKGKVVLTTSRASLVHKIACVEREAIGVLTYVPPSGIDEIASLRRYEGLWPDAGEGKKTKFGFALTQADGVKMRELLDEGKTVKIKAKVQAKLGVGKHALLTAVIPGKVPSQEIWIAAHVCHPHSGANDNASGSGALLESLRIISKLIATGELKKPDYSIRYIWMPEWNSTIQFIHNEKELLSRCRMMINADMVGANPAKSGSVLNLYRTPYSLPSSLNNVVHYWLREEGERVRPRSGGGTIAPLPWKYTNYSAGSDHFMFTDSTLGIPGIMLNQNPDRFYHTSTDTTDKIDPAQMAYATRVITLSALTLAYTKHASKEAILAHCRNETVSILHKVSSEALNIFGRCLDNPEEVYPRTMRWLGYIKELGLETIDTAGKEWPLISEQKSIAQALKASIEMAYATEMVVVRKGYVGACAEAGLQAKEDELFDLETTDFGLEIRRTLQYALPPSIVMKLPEERWMTYLKVRKDDPHIIDRFDELLNLCKEWTPLDEIWEKICLQFGPIEKKMFSEIVEDLKTLGVLETKEV
ncbi:MAG: DUF4910 domain-containing protein [Candidatus Thorarchaeota archaeon]|jgi:hypothetical protein